MHGSWDMVHDGQMDGRTDGQMDGRTENRHNIEVGAPPKNLIWKEYDTSVKSLRSQKFVIYSSPLFPMSATVEIIGETYWG